MKKLLMIAIFCLFTLVSGVMLTACCSKSSDRKLSFSYDESLINLQITANGEVLEPNSNGKFVVDDNADVRVEVFTTAFGVDFSNVNLKINKSTRSFFIDNGYDAVAGIGQCAGYFLLPKVNEDSNIKISGLSIKTAKFNVECDNVEETKDKLKTVSINANGDTYVNLYDFLTSANPTFTRAYDQLYGSESAYRSINLKFENEQIYDISSGNFISIKDEDDVMFMVRTVREGTTVNASYSDLIYADQFTINFDLTQLEYQDFQINLPKENMTYSVTVDKDTVNYSQERTLTLTKKLLSSQANYDAVKVFLNSRELKNGVDNKNGTFTFTIPSNMTPNLARDPNDLNEYDDFTVYVGGISFAQGQTHKLFAKSQEDLESQIINPTFGMLNGGVVSAFSYDEEGNQVLVDGQTASVNWSYELDEVDGVKFYKMPYGLYDYSVYVNGQLLLRLDECIPDGSSDDFGQNVQKRILFENGASGGAAPQAYTFTFTAKFNDETQVYDTFALTFGSVEDVEIVLKDYVPSEQTVNLGYQFDEGLNVQKVEYYIASPDGTATEWEELENGEMLEKLLTHGQIVAFRLTTDVESFQIGLSNSVVANLLEEIHVDGYVLISFAVSENFWDINSQEVELKLVSVN